MFLIIGVAGAGFGDIDISLLHNLQFLITDRPVVIGGVARTDAVD